MRFLPLLALLAIALVTLTPGSPSGTGESEVVLCLLCKEGWLADLVVNLPLFIPLGIALALSGRSAGRATLLSLLTSMAIEVTQLAIPGRFTDLSDLVANTLGGGLGALLVPLRHRLLDPPERERMRRAFLAPAAVAALLLLSAALQRPALADGVLYPRWTPELRYMDRWNGTVERVEIGGLEVVDSDLSLTGRLHALLREGTGIAVEGTAGPRRTESRLAAIFVLVDGERREILVLGESRNALVWRFRTLGTAIGLRQPSIRWPGAFDGIVASDPVRIEAELTPEGRAILGMNGARGGGLEPSPAVGWSQLFGRGVPDPAGRHPLDLLWMSLLGIPLGLWARRGREWAFSVLLLAGVLFLAPRIGPLSPPSPWNAGALLAGASLTALSARSFRRRRRAAARAAIHSSPV